jgi:hypothetical protein
MHLQCYHGPNKIINAIKRSISGIGMTHKCEVDDLHNLSPKKSFELLNQNRQLKLKLVDENGKEKSQDNLSDVIDGQ